MTAVSASPTAAACCSTSTSNSVLPTIDHQVAVPGHAIAVKSRLHQAPLPQVECAFAGQQTLAEQAFAPFESSALGEIPVVRDEHIANQLRLVDEEQLFAGHPVRRDVAVRACELREEVERVRAAWTVDE
jgi:hypothetical protein